MVSPPCYQYSQKQIEIQQFLLAIRKNFPKSQSSYLYRRPSGARYDKQYYDKWVYITYGKGNSLYLSGERTGSRPTPAARILLLDPKNGRMPFTVPGLAFSAGSYRPRPVPPT